VAVQLTILPVIVEPLPDELFSSWLFRLANVNLTKAHSFTRFHLPQYNVWNRDIDKLASDNLIKRLSLLTGISEDTIFNTTLRSYEGKLFTKCNANGNQKWILPLGIFHRTRKRFGLQFCPKCLIDDGKIPYYRKTWRLALSITCPKCNILLLDRCPYCDKPITFFRDELGFKLSVNSLGLQVCYSCKSDLRTSPRCPSRIGMLGFQQRMLAYIEQTACKGRTESVSYFDVLYQVVKILRSQQKHYQSFRNIISNYEGRALINKQPREFELAEVIFREATLMTAVWILDCWPGRFVTLCKEARLSSHLLYKDLISPPDWFVREVRSALHFPTAIELNPNRGHT
jgi:hypothetical protein